MPRPPAIDVNDKKRRSPRAAAFLCAAGLSVRAAARQDKSHQLFHILKVVIVAVHAFPVVYHSVFLVFLQTVEQRLFSKTFDELRECSCTVRKQATENKR